MWDTLSGSEILSNVNDSSSIVLTEFIDESSAIVISYNTASCYETETGNLLWQNDDSAITYSTKVEPLGSYIYFLDDFNIEIYPESQSNTSDIQLPINFISFGEIESDDIRVYIKQEVYNKLEEYEEGYR
jgi:hypothetical protein